MKNRGAYESLGVSASKAGLHQVIAEAGLAGNAGLFAQVSGDLAGDPAYASAVHCDGAGTKPIIAYLYYRETGSGLLFAGLAQDAVVMNLDDIYCLGRPESLILGNTISRNARLIGDEIIGFILCGYRDQVTRLSSLGVHISLCGGETADCGDIVRTLIVDAVICARIARRNLIDTRAIVPGDVIIGLSSTGQASYESRPHSGIGSNGLTLARHALLCKDYLKQYPEVSDTGLEPGQLYRGPFRVSDFVSELGITVGEALSSPTRTYAPVLSKIYQELGNYIHGVIHLTGGGQSKVLRFGKENLYIKNDLFEVPPVFSLIQHHGRISWQEMYQVFNMGHRMELYVPPQCAAPVIDIAGSFNISAKQVGQVEKQTSSIKQNILRIESNNGTFEYREDL